MHGQYDPASPPHRLAPRFLGLEASDRWRRVRVTRIIASRPTLVGGTIDTSSDIMEIFQHTVANRTRLRMPASSPAFIVGAAETPLGKVLDHSELSMVALAAKEALR